MENWHGGEDLFMAQQQMTKQEKEKLYQVLLARSNRPETFSYINGIRITELGDGWAKGEMTITENSLNPLGTVHGGAICTFMDQVTGVASCTRGSTCRTINCDVRFLAPGIKGKLYAYAQAIHMGGSIAVMRSEVRNEDGQLCAEGTYTLRMKDGLPTEE